MAFIIGGLSYRAGLFSSVKKSILVLISHPTPTGLPKITATQIPEITPSFSFEFVDDPSIAAMNDEVLIDDNESLNFLVAGHIYGKPGEDDFHPAMTFLTNLALFRESGFDMFFFLGDTVWKPTDENFDLLDSFLLNQVDIPIFNAVGNHDVYRRDTYEKRYGETVYAFEFKDNYFIVLDTTLKYYDISESQIVFVKDMIERSKRSGNVKNIHILMHHLLFLEDTEILGKQVIKPNEGNGMSDTFRNFLDDVIYPASEIIPIYIYAGDVGAFESGNLSPLYKKSERHDVHFLATGIGNTDKDSVLIVEETLNGKIVITPFSLKGKEMQPIEEYDFDYWLKK